MAIDKNGEFTDIAKTWATGLRSLNGEQIAKGLHACCDDNSNEWPSLPMFKAKCKSAPIENAAMYRETPKGLPEPEWRKWERKEKALSAIEELKNKLK